MYRMRSRTWSRSQVDCKPFSGDFDVQINTQAPDYVAGFAVYITLEYCSIDGKEAEQRRTK